MNKLNGCKTFELKFLSGIGDEDHLGTPDEQCIRVINKGFILLE